MKGEDTVRPGDPRYADLLRRGFNKRFTGQPDSIRLVRSTDDVIAAVQEAVRDNLRLAVRSGGHCLEGFVADPEVRTLIDTSLMTGVDWDPRMDAFVVASGTTLGELYRRLFLGWGVTVPAGESADIGVGGHVSGGAFGFLCREHGLAADYLHAVEVVVVDAAGTARSVVATREPSDPNRELWWAHTGGGGGNFGVVTRVWFQDLPRAPESVLTCRAAWRWEDLDQAAFSRLLRNHGDWCARNGDAESPYSKLYSLLLVKRRQAGTIDFIGVSTAGAEAERQFDEHLAAISEGIGASRSRAVERSSWLTFAQNPFPELFRAPGMENVRTKMKDAFLRRRFSDRQIDVVHQYMTRSDHDVPGGALGLATYGGKVNTVAPHATASVQRDSILTTSCSAGWMDPRDDARSMAWVRAFYRDLYADTGGVPAPGELCDGAFINHPDADLADPALNTSGVPWHALYYKDNYPRLQKAKARFDPRNVFRHALSIPPSPADEK